MSTEKPGTGDGRSGRSARRWPRSVRLPLHRVGREEAERLVNNAEAGERTGHILCRLPEGDWTVVSNFRSRHGEMGHVAIGPTGVYLLASHKPTGCVRVKDGVPWLRHGSDAQGDRRSVTIVRKVVDPARVLQREIRARTGQIAWVQPVVVLWSEFPQLVAETSQVSFVQGRNLAVWMQGRPHQLDVSGREEVAEAMRVIAREGIRRAPRVPRRHAA